MIDLLAAVVAPSVFAVLVLGAGTPQRIRDPMPQQPSPATEHLSAASVPAVLDSAAAPEEAVLLLPAGAEDTKAPDYAVPWKSINGGGGTLQSGTHKVSLSVGQAAIGYVTGTNHRAGIGFWYGVPSGAAGCDCGTAWGDLNADRVINAVDVVVIVNYVYKNLDRRSPLPNCPRQPGDWDCVAPINAVDVVIYVNYVYKQMNQFCADPCGP